MQSTHSDHTSDVKTSSAKRSSDTGITLMTPTIVTSPRSSPSPLSSTNNVLSTKSNGITTEEAEAPGKSRHINDSLRNISKQQEQQEQHSQNKRSENRASLSDLYGLEGMLKVIRTNNVDLNILAVGTDLTALGLNLHNSGSLSSSFVSPLLDEQPTKEDLELVLPPQYYINSPALKMTRLQNLIPETLMYIFYTIVGSVLQGYAAAELYNRRWVYHNAYRKWFTTPSSQKQDGPGFLDMSKKETEWIYFEPACWKKCLYSGNLDESHFMKPNELRELLNNFVQHLCSPGTTLSDVSGATAQSSINSNGFAPHPTASHGLESHGATPHRLEQHVLCSNGLAPNTTGQNPLGHHSLGSHPIGQNLLGQHPLGRNSLGENSLGENTLGENSLGQNSLGQNSLGQNPLGQNPLGQNSLGQNSLGQNSLGQNSLGQNSLGQNSLGPSALGPGILGPNAHSQNGLGFSGLSQAGLVSNTSQLLSDPKAFYARPSTFSHNQTGNNFFFPSRTPPAPPPGFGHSSVEDPYPSSSSITRPPYSNVSHSLLYQDQKNTQPSSSRESLNSS